MAESNEYYLRRCIQVSRESREHGNTPFGALLTDKDGNILMEQEHRDHPARRHRPRRDRPGAPRQPRVLARLPQGLHPDTTAEPCAMCSGAIYWAGIGRVVYGMTERRLLQGLTGSNEQNPTFDLRRPTSLPVARRTSRSRSLPRGRGGGRRGPQGLLGLARRHG